MKNILSKPSVSESLQESNPPSFKDKWARDQISFHDHTLDQHGAEIRDHSADIRGIKAILCELSKKGAQTEWKTFVSSDLIYSSVEVPLNIKTTFEKLEEDFTDFSNRIIWCNELKKYLADFEETIEEYNEKYLSWFVSTLKDVFSYNYAETITEEQLELLKNGIEIICERQEICNKESFAKYHLQLVESGLSLLPNTQKAIDELGE